VGIAATSETNIVPIRALSDKGALAWLVGKARTETSTAALARDWLWSASKVRRRLARWSSAGHIEVKPGLGGRTVITVPEPVASCRPRLNTTSHDCRTRVQSHRGRSR
jgi:hypothetical protein